MIGVAVADVYRAQKAPAAGKFRSSARRQLSALHLERSFEGNGTIAAFATQAKPARLRRCISVELE